MKLNISAICNKFSAKGYVKLKIVFLPLIPVSICVPVYSGNYLRNSFDKYFFHAPYLMYIPVSKLYEHCGTKRVRFKRPKSEIKKLCSLEKNCKITRETD